MVTVWHAIGNSQRAEGRDTKKPPSFVVARSSLSVSRFWYCSGHAMAIVLEIRDGEVWVTRDLAEGWSVEYRLALEDAGSVVVAELRVSQPDGSVPTGGLRARALRLLRFGDALDLSREALALLRQGEDLSRPGGVVFTPHGRAWLTRQAKGPGGRKGRDDFFYAGIAAHYSHEARESRHATQAVAELLTLSPSRARELIATARARGLLTHTTQGRAGGQLTDKARELLQLIEVEGIPSAEAFGTASIGPVPKGTSDG
jgi:hypothetical protein